MYRRQAIISLLTLTAGCNMRNERPAGPRRKYLEIRPPTLQEQNGSWILNGQVSNETTYEKESDYHDVTVVAYDKSGERLCVTSLGTISRHQSKKYALNCPEIPHLITADTAEDPCEENVLIHILIHEGVNEDGSRVWDRSRYRQCGEGLPPTYSETEER